jgi:hypothetical protein
VARIQPDALNSASATVSERVCATLPETVTVVIACDAVCAGDPKTKAQRRRCDGDANA